MDVGQVISKVQELSQIAGLAFNGLHPGECRAILAEISNVIVENVTLPKTAVEEKPADTILSGEPAEPVEEKVEGTEPGPEAQASEE